MEFVELMQSLQGTVSQEEFGQRIGIAQTLVSAIYRGTRQPGAKVLQGLVRAFPERQDEIAASFFAFRQHFRTVKSTEILPGKQEAQA